MYPSPIHTAAWNCLRETKTKLLCFMGPNKNQGFISEVYCLEFWKYQHFIHALQRNKLKVIGKGRLPMYFEPKTTYTL
jgi:hypothetical protein